MRGTRRGARGGTRTRMRAWRGRAEASGSRRCLRTRRWNRTARGRLGAETTARLCPGGARATGAPAEQATPPSPPPKGLGGPARTARLQRRCLPLQRAQRRPRRPPRRARSPARRCESTWTTSIAASATPTASVSAPRHAPALPRSAGPRGAPTPCPACKRHGALQERLGKQAPAPRAACALSASGRASAGFDGGVRRRRRRRRR
jgi:hypothetical protein